jgi:hypothetical protein
MALTPRDSIHANQISAGTTGRRRGHDFESKLTNEINNGHGIEGLPTLSPTQHLFKGEPGPILLSYILGRKGIKPKNIRAWWLGGLATDSAGDELRDAEQNVITKSKSDVVIDFETDVLHRVGVSVKTCYASSPTNDQLFFTTASAFCALLKRNGVPVSGEAENALKMFCGDVGFRPSDMGVIRENVDPSRWFWEELPTESLAEWQGIFSTYQAEITGMLFRKAYKTEPITPEFVIHLTKGYSSIEEAEFAIFSIDELIAHSLRFGGFSTRPYQIRKGSFKHDTATHEAPRFGYVQMQRGGQKQHPTQLQFNLMAGYFYKLPE